jgi:hypothetical protein
MNPEGITDRPAPPWGLPGAVRQACEPHRGRLVTDCGQAAFVLSCLLAVTPLALLPDLPWAQVWGLTPYQFGIDQGPVVLAVENYRTGLIWGVMRRCPYVVAGLRRAGFTGGWL